MPIEDRNDHVRTSPENDNPSEGILTKPRWTSIVHVPAGVLGMDRRGLSTLADAIYLTMLLNAKPYLREQDIHMLRLADLARGVGFTSRNVFHLRNTLRELGKKVVVWDLLRQKDDWGFGKMFDRIEIRRDAAGVVIEYVYESRLRERLDSVPFAQINLKTLRRIRGKYGRRLYLIVKSAEYRGSLTVKIGNLRHTLGVPDSAHPAWPEFRKKVILPAMEAVHKVSDISISFDLIHDEDAGEPASVIFRIKRTVAPQGPVPPKGKAGSNTAVLWKAIYDLKAELAELRKKKRRR